MFEIIYSDFTTSICHSPRRHKRYLRMTVSLIRSICFWYGQSYTYRPLLYQADSDQEFVQPRTLCVEPRLSCPSPCRMILSKKFASDRVCIRSGHGVGVLLVASQINILRGVCVILQLPAAGQILRNWLSCMTGSLRESNLQSCLCSSRIPNK